MGKTKVKEPQTLADAIRRERERREWSQSKLARMLDTPEKNVKNWESGNTLPSFGLYARMCLLFEWSLPYSGDSDNPGWLNGDGQAMPDALTVGQPLAGAAR
jgi:ribosome-binding protein aMBF1 (putative translation factor)